MPESQTQFARLWGHGRRFLANRTPEKLNNHKFIQEVENSSRPTNYGSSGNSGECCSDFEGEVLVVSESIGPSLDDLDLVVDAFEQAGV